MNLKAFIIIGILVEVASAFGKHENGRSSNVAEGSRDVSNRYRLPDDIIPMTYDVKIIPIMEVGNFSFTGSVTIQFLAQNSTSSITLHTKGLNVTEHSLYDITSPNTTINMVNATNYEDTDFHVLYLETPLTMGSNYSLTMKFKGILQEDLDGFYICSYTNETGDTEWMAVTQFEPVSARKAFPCFDESRLKAKFTISIARPEHMTTLSNMPNKATTKDDADLPLGYVMDHYEQTPTMSTYLVAFSVSKFVANPPDAESTFRVWSRRNAIDQTDFIVGEAPKVLDVMRNITSISYNLPKMDLVAVPDFFAGAMENWGLLTFRETYLLYQEDSSTSYDKQMVILVTAHEMSHQWFGDLVSPEWWSYMWLSEGFATYCMYVVTDEIEPTWRLMEQFVVERVQAPLVSDAMEYSKPMVYDVINPIDEDYESKEIAYDKASSTIRMMEHVVTKEVLFQGLRKYLKERQFNSANENMLFDAIQAEANGLNVLPPNVTVNDVWSTWTTQSGYPVITVNRSNSEGTVVIDQKRFVLEDFDYDKQQRWWIPISYTTEVSMNFNETRPSHWMSPTDPTITVNEIPLEAGFLIFNIQQTGYYRVNYDEKNWELITRYLKSKNYTKIHPVNRGQLLDDALNLARGGYLKYPVALELGQYLAQETDFIPWDSAYPLIDFLDMHMSESKFYGSFQAYMANIMNAQYEKLQFKESPSDDQVTRLSRLLLLPRACKYDVGDCIMEAVNSFQNWSMTNVNIIPANLRDAVYCYAIAMGGKEEWEFLWSAYVNTSTASEKERIMGALGCSRDRDILTEYLNKTLEKDSKIRRQDQAAVFSSVYTRVNGLGVTLDFLIARLNEITEKCGMSTTSGIILGISSRITTTEKASQMVSFLENNLNNLPGREDTVEKAKKYINSNMDWGKSYENTVANWLADNYPLSSSASLQASMVFVAVAAILSRYFY